MTKQDTDDNAALQVEQACANEALKRMMAATAEGREWRILYEDAQTDQRRVECRAGFIKAIADWRAAHEAMMAANDAIHIIQLGQLNRLVEPPA